MVLTYSTVAWHARYVSNQAHGVMAVGMLGPTLGFGLHFMSFEYGLTRLQPYHAPFVVRCGPPRSTALHWR